MKPKRLHYGWIMVMATSGIAFTNAINTYSFGLFLKPLAEEFNAGRAVISGSRSLGGLLGGVLGIGIGKLTDKRGPRILLICNGLLIGTGLLLLSQTNAVWQIYVLYGVVISIGMACYGIPLYSTIPRWFSRRREMALGIVQSSLGLGGAVMVPVSQWLIVNHGWRISALAIGLLILSVVIPLAQLLKHSPQRIGLRPYGESETPDEKRPPASAVSSLTFAQTIRTERFWILAAILFCFHYSLASVEIHIVPYATDIGLSPTVSATVLSLVAGAGIAGKLSIGFISDKMETRSALCLYLAMLCLSLTELLFARQAFTLYAFAIVFGIGYGGVLTYFPGLTTQLFGLQNLSMIYATATLFGTVGRATGPILSGRLFDINGNYHSAFLILTALGALSFVLAMILLRHKVEKTDSTV